MQIQISWLFQKPTDLDLHCLQSSIYPSSAGQGLMLIMLNKNISKHFDIFPGKQDLTFHANWHWWRQFAWVVKSCFLNNNKKNIIKLSAEFAHRVVMVNLINWRKYFLFVKYHWVFLHKANILSVWILNLFICVLVRLDYKHWTTSMIFANRFTDSVR